MNRRSFLYDLSIFSGGLALAGSGLMRRVAAFEQDGDLSKFRAFGYGELVPTASKNTGETILSLPKGFEYNVLGRMKETMSDGRPTPILHDGMWTFKVGNEVRIVRNHEVTQGSVPRENAGIGAKNHYDPEAGGGTTTLVIDPKTNTVVRDFVSLSGTLVNCAGGHTPWGSWITCEETTLGPTVRTDDKGRKRGGFKQKHGYCFEVPAAANSEVVPVPLKAMGRFTHEAISVDRKTGIVYETEDYDTAGFYRFLPNKKGKLAEGGKLQMLAVKGRPQFDTRTGQTVGERLETYWVNIDKPDPDEADLDPNVVYKEGFGKGGCTFARLEGCDIDTKGIVYFTSTSGGKNKGGQIWAYQPTGRDTGILTLVFESPDQKVLHMPDNICLMPKSRRIMICEDSDYAGQRSVNHLRILTEDGKVADFAQNISKEFPRSEFCGSVFSPDGRTMFVNLQLAGVTLAITGDWSKFRA
jgi:secreted PhoX family phosphatase